MKKLIKILLISSGVIISSLHYASAEPIDRYKCSSAGPRNGVPVKIVGRGLIYLPEYKGDIIFCSKENASDCYDTQETINSAIGRAEYVTLLTASILGKSVGFYCNSNKWVQNIHIES